MPSPPLASGVVTVFQATLHFPPSESHCKHDKLVQELINPDAKIAFKFILDPVPK